MRDQYMGKTCPYCKTPLGESETLVVCDTCDMPHHLSCWQDNQGCTTFGCSGKIKEVIPGKAVVREAEEPATPATTLLETPAAAPVVHTPVAAPAAPAAAPVVHTPVAAPVVQTPVAAPVENPEARPVKKKKKGKVGCGITLGCGTVLVIALVLVSVVGILFSMPFSKYRRACDALEQGNYVTAYNLFLELDGFLDSEELLKETQYREALAFGAAGQYQAAYMSLTSLGYYSNSRDEALEILCRWAEQALDTYLTGEAETLAAHATLERDQYDRFYSTLISYINSHPQADHWAGSTYSQNMLVLLKLLPSSYEDTALLTQLFEVISEYDGYENLFRDNELLARQCWSLTLVQNMARHNDGISYFLEGYWTGSGYYLNFYENDSGGTTCSYDLPWVSEPYGTKYFDIDGMVYYFDDANGNHLASVYRFEILDYDTIKVFCYKNNREYTMYR